MGWRLPTQMSGLRTVRTVVTFLTWVVRQRGPKGKDFERRKEFFVVVKSLALLRFWKHLHNQLPFGVTKAPVKSALVWTTKKNYHALHWTIGPRQPYYSYRIKRKMQKRSFFDFSRHVGALEVGPIQGISWIRILIRVLWQKLSHILPKLNVRNCRRN